MDSDVIVEKLSAIGPVEEHRLESNEELEAAVKRLGNDLERIVVGGGDGTLSRCVSVIRKADVPMGVLPLGTANDFARTLDIPENLEQAIDIILDQYSRKVDLGKANDHFFLNAAGIGVGPEMTKAMDAERKKKLGVFAYLVSLFEVLGRNWRRAAILRLPGKRKGLRFMQITIANGRHYGGGMTITEDADPSDGLFNIICLKPQSVLNLIGKFFTLRWGVNKEKLPYPGMHVFQAKDVEVITRKKTEVTLDGELLTETPLVCSVIPDAIEVYVQDPQKSQGFLESTL